MTGFDVAAATLCGRVAWPRRRWARRPHQHRAPTGCGVVLAHRARSASVLPSACACGADLHQPLGGGLFCSGEVADIAANTPPACVVSSVTENTDQYVRSNPSTRAANFTDVFLPGVVQFLPTEMKRVAPRVTPSRSDEK